VTLFVTTEAAQWFAAGAATQAIQPEAPEVLSEQVREVCPGKGTGSISRAARAVREYVPNGLARGSRQPENRDGLAEDCKQAVETAKIAMAAYGCDW
jgi:hypothetical protein